jgi:hypothetical protein
MYYRFGQKNLNLQGQEHSRNLDRQYNIKTDLEKKQCVMEQTGANISTLDKVQYT